MVIHEFVTIGRLADSLAIPRWKLAYLIDRGDVPGPSLTVPGRRLFSPEDTRNIRQALADRERRSSDRGHPVDLSGRASSVRHTTGDEPGLSRLEGITAHRANSPPS